MTVRDPEGGSCSPTRPRVELVGAASLDALRALSLDAILERFALYDPDGRPLARDDVGWVRALEGRRAAAPRARAARRPRDRRAALALVEVLGAARQPRADRRWSMNVTEDVTAVKRAELGQRLLAEAGRLLSATTDLEATLQQIAQLTVPALADWCAIELPGAGGRLQLVAVAHLDPEKVALAHRLRARHPVRLDDDGASARVIRTGEPVRMGDITPAMLRDAAQDDEHFALLEALGLSALLVVPLRSGEEVLGALTLVASQPHRRFDDAD